VVVPNNVDALEWLRKHLEEDGTDVLAEMVKLAERLMSAEVDALCNAGWDVNSGSAVVPQTRTWVPESTTCPLIECDHRLVALWWKTSNRSLRRALALRYRPWPWLAAGSLWPAKDRPAAYRRRPQALPTG